MWTTDQTQLDVRTHHYRLRSGDGPLSVRQWITLSVTNSTFRGYFNGVLAASPFAAYFWETPPTTVASLDAPFEWVLLESDALQRMRPDNQAFAEHFVPNTLAATFNNLGRDSRLVAPTPAGDASTHVHLANFVRGASPAQLDSFWQLVASEFERSLDSQPRWLSTSGLGIGWLHVRIDRRPKYYNHAAYATGW